MKEILVAGIGNIFMGDDAWGVEVANALLRKRARDGVKIVDFGIRGLDLAFALMDGWELAILVDAAPRGHAPGTVSVVEPELDGGAEVAAAGHGLDPAQVLHLVRQMGGTCGRMLLVACEPADLGGEAGVMGLSAPVMQAVEAGVATVESLIIAHFAQTRETVE